MRDIGADRVDYDGEELREDVIGADPLAAFSTWLEAAYEAGSAEPTAMQVATVGMDADGAVQPHVRTVLLKALDTRGFVFFTNYRSAKSRDMLIHPQVGLHWYWPVLARAVRVEGHAEQVGPDESRAYFATRPRGSQLAAWASDQSSPIEGTAQLRAAYAEAEERFGVGEAEERFGVGDEPEVPCPEYWGGWCVVPRRIEFWQGKPSRLHERLACTRVDGGWQTQRLAP